MSDLYFAAVRSAYHQMDHNRPDNTVPYRTTAASINELREAVEDYLEYNAVWVDPPQARIHVKSYKIVKHYSHWNVWAYLKDATPIGVVSQSEGRFQRILICRAGSQEDAVRLLSFLR